MENYMSKKAIAISIVIALFFITAIWFAYSFVKQEENQNWLTLYGNIDIRDVSLSFRVSGRILSMDVDEGAHVKKGQVLARLDKDTFIANLETAKAQLEQAIANQKNASRTYKRREQLVDDGAVSKALFDDAVAMKDSSSAEVSVAKANLEKAQISLNDTEIHAPTHGTILTRIQEPGAIVNVAEPVYTLAIDNPVWVRTYIDEPFLGRIYPGQDALVYTDSNPEKPYKGHIGFISPQAEFTPKIVETTQLRTDLVYRIRVVIDQPDNGLRQGMPVTVKIHLKANS
ncbi:TPA: efflux RND transporter periplasmic adaptor subunit [Legionella pneumophila subsp. pneumophila]|uniref:Efflux RND transporter periplasmic adaptor subunit n=2 Tax=Legionella pneumophila TaxID=446 RepID=A0A2S8CCW8_LEGPN|nr:efflux RND transporter periplasmic adaptor subunit [Legionella pneumophila]HAT8878482.1 efflux RND transporter periplasmic adaptor subunit [Legionella pneumophila subsp. pneumophila]RYX04634.1 efflux RND transporter periplasmic adaptor subunit [Legionella pneumophila]TIE24925.1 efflux RND transporter periplasmic adaptor subunit [Legionella pneumophila]TIE45765.1 efflux RND transporter periplasmic adaptor subunit [Legionella pneumophila]